jgi:pyruvate/2-oxoglutarate dehydrogenase complex dihydrolipoamide acyltransferase (E2) component
MNWQEEAKSLGIKYVGRKKRVVLAEIEAAKAKAAAPAPPAPAPAPAPKPAPAPAPAPVEVKAVVAVVAAAVPDVSNHRKRCSCDACRANRGHRR